MPKQGGSIDNPRIPLDKALGEMTALNFYKHPFQQPGFDPRRMAEVIKNPGLEALENSLNTLVQNMRTELFDKNRPNIFSPRLKNRLILSSEAVRSIVYLQCECKGHDVVGPRSLAFLK